MKKLVLVIVILMFAVMAQAKSITLSWDASPTATAQGYEICYTTQAGLLVEGQDVPSSGMIPTCLDVGNVLTLIVPGPVDGDPDSFVDETPYYFGVVAYDDVEKRSVLSNIVESRGFSRPEPASNNRGTSTVNNIPVPVK